MRHKLLMWIWKRSHKKLALLLLIGAVLFSLVDLRHEVSAMTPVDNNCITQAVAQINKVRYLGKNSNGQDEVEVNWLVHSVSECVPFGSGPDVAGKSDIPPHGYEITVKIKRRLGNEDSATVRKAEIVKGNITTIVRIARANLETDPVSFEAKLTTTAGAVLKRTVTVSGNGAPSLAGATQTFRSHSTVANTPDGCFPHVQVDGINFIPGSGATPDKVTVNWFSGSPPPPCIDPPGLVIFVRVKRPDGHFEVTQANLPIGQTTATVAISGAPGGVASFEVAVTAISGAVVEKTSTQSGNF